MLVTYVRTSQKDAVAGKNRKMVDTNEVGMIYTPHTTQEVDDMKSPYFTYNSASAFHLSDRSCVLAFSVIPNFPIFFTTT